MARNSVSATFDLFEQIKATNLRSVLLRFTEEMIEVFYT